MAEEVPITVPPGTPDDVEVRTAPRAPQPDPTCGIPVETAFADGPEPPNRLVVIGDSLSHGFQSGAVYNTDLSYPAIIAHELGWFDDYRYPRYGGPGGLPINVEYLLRDLEHRFGPDVDWLEMPFALFRGRQFLDEVEDYWERGPGSLVPAPSAINHDLSVYGWDLRDALERSFDSCQAVLGSPTDNLFKQVVEHHGERAALRVYPPTEPTDTLFEAAARLGEETDGGATDHGIETLVVFLGANNALRTVTDLKVVWSKDPGYRDLSAKNAYTVWRPSHFASELAEVVTAVRKIKARHVIWCNVPHVTIPPVARGIGSKLRPGSRYFPYYTRPWIEPSQFDVHQDPHITGDQARTVDSAIDQYNESIEAVVAAGRHDQLDWYLLDVAGLLDRVASRRYLADPNARPPWWTPYPLPPALAALDPTPDSRFLTSDGHGGRATGGLFSLDGVHPTTVGYGLIAQELITIMRTAGVAFRLRNSGTPRPDPVAVDFDRLIRRDTLVRTPPQNITPSLHVLGWADEGFDLMKRALFLRM